MTVIKSKVVQEFVTKHGTATTVPRNNQSISSSVKLEVYCIVLYRIVLACIGLS